MTTDRVSEDSSSVNNNGRSDMTIPTACPEKKIEFQELLRIVVRRFIRGFSAGLGIHAGYALIKSVIRGSFIGGLVKAWRAVRDKSSIRTATFLGLFPSIYRLALHYVKETRVIQDEWNYLISGAIAGLSILTLDKNNRQTITFFSLSRAIGAGIPVLVARGDLPSVPGTDIAVFSVCTGIILYCVALRPDYLSPGYYQSILKWAQDYSDSMITKLFRTPSSKFVTCQQAGLHKGSCIKHNLLFLRRGIPAMAKIYLPIYALPILLYRRKALVYNPKSVIKSFVKNMASSTSFLVTMVTMAKLGLCVLRNAGHRPPPVSALVPLVSGTLGAWLGILWERKSRQRELALFNIFQVLGICYAAFNKSTIGCKQGVGIPQGFTILFSVAMMVVMHAYETRPELLNSVTKSGLGFLVGPRDIAADESKNDKIVEEQNNHRDQTV